MRRIEIVMRPQDVGKALDVLNKAGNPGVMVTEIEGHGRQKGVTQQWRGQEYKVDLLPKVKLDVIVSNKEVEGIVKAVSGALKTGEIGDGKIFISDVADAVRIRTGERGDAALK